MFIGLNCALSLALEQHIATQLSVVLNQTTTFPCRTKSNKINKVGPKLGDKSVENNDIQTNYTLQSNNTLIEMHLVSL